MLSMMKFHEEYIIDMDDDIYRHQWLAYDVARLQNELQQIEKEVYDEICEELSDECFGEQEDI